MPQHAQEHVQQLRLLRLGAAYLVLFSHQFALMGRAGPNLPVKDLGLIGVMVVFSISGYLVTKSWDN